MSAALARWTKQSRKVEKRWRSSTATPKPIQAPFTRICIMLAGLMPPSRWKGYSIQPTTMREMPHSAVRTPATCASRDVRSARATPAWGFASKGSVIPYRIPDRARLGRP